MTSTSANPAPIIADASLGLWEDTPRRPPASEAPVLAVAGFEGPLDWLLEMARAQRVDLARLSIIDLVEAFIVALNAALDRQSVRADLSRWGEWLVMAATLALLRSRLMLPAEAPEARAAQDEAETLRRQLLERVAILRASEWLEHRIQLGREVFGRGGGADSVASSGRTADITDLLRACLVALAIPEQADAYQLQFRTLWRVPDAIARITRMLAIRPEGGPLGSFLPQLNGTGPEKELRCRAALASTFLAGLELAREGNLALQQEQPWRNVLLISSDRPQP